MKGRHKKWIWEGALVLSSILSSCSMFLEANYDGYSNYPQRQVYAQRGMPNIPNLTQQQAYEIQRIRAEERRMVERLQQQRNEILYDMQRADRGYSRHNMNSLRKELAKVDKQIEKVQRNADKQAKSVLNAHQRKYVNW